MSNPLDPVRAVFNKAVGPFKKRQQLITEMKESDLGKERRANMVKESAELDAEWVEALHQLRKAMDECPTLQPKQGK